MDFAALAMASRIGCAVSSGRTMMERDMGFPWLTGRIRSRAPDGDECDITLSELVPNCGGGLSTGLSLINSTSCVSSIEILRLGLALLSGESDAEV